MVVKHKSIKGSIVSMAFGGDGIIRHQGQVVFVPFTLVGDHIEAGIMQVKKSFAKARLQKILEPSGERIEAPCEYFGRCGGCQLQHADYSAQLSIKKSFVNDALSRIGKLAVPLKDTRGTKAQWHYRRHIRLHWKKGRLGYIHCDQHSLIEIAHCPIFTDDNQDIIETVRRLCKELQLKDQTEISLYKSGNDFIVLFDSLSSTINYELIFTEEIKRNNRIKGISWKINDAFFNVGDITIKFFLDSLSMAFNPKVFVQAHPEQSAALYKQMVEIIKTLKIQKILDLYCGFGATSLLLRQIQLDVFGIEYNSESIRFARENEVNNHLSGIEWLVGDVDSVLKDAINRFQPDCVLVNPPRTGLTRVVIDIMKKYLPNHIIYISCMPATLARDVAFFSKDYDICYCEPFDMFPQTTHVETLMYLRKKD